MMLMPEPAAMRSRPSRARELKQDRVEEDVVASLSRPSRARELKPQRHLAVG